MKYCDNLFSQQNLIIKSLKFRSNLHSRSHPMCLSFHAGHFRMSYKGYLFDFSSTHAISTPVISDFWSVFHSKPYFLHRPPGRHLYQKMWNFQKGENERKVDFNGEDDVIVGSFLDYQTLPTKAWYKNTLTRCPCICGTKFGFNTKKQKTSSTAIRSHSRFQIFDHI